MNTLQPGLYRHYKGEIYALLGTVIDTSAGEVALYARLGVPGAVFTRLVTEFGRTVCATTGCVRYGQAILGSSAQCPICTGPMTPRFTYMESLARDSAAWLIACLLTRDVEMPVEVTEGGSHGLWDGEIVKCGEGIGGGVPTRLLLAGRR